MVGQEPMISLQPEQPSLAREDSGHAPQASKEVDRGSHLERLPFTKKDSRPAPLASKKGRRELKQRRAPSTGVEDFVHWVAPISSHLPPSPTSEEEEEEDEMADLVHNFPKRGASFKRVTDSTPEVVGEADQHLTSRGSKGQAIVVMDSSEMGFHGQSTLKTALSTDLGEVPLTYEEVRDGIPSKETTSRSCKATSSRSEGRTPLLSHLLLLNSYIPPQGQAPLMEEVSVHGFEGA